MSKLYVDEITYVCIHYQWEFREIEKVQEKEDIVQLNKAAQKRPTNDSQIIFSCFF